MIWFYLILLVVGIFIDRSIKEMKKENQTLDSELENCKKEVGIQYRQRAYLWNEQQECADEFNKLANEYLKMKDKAIAYEKIYSKKVHNHKHYKDEYDLCSKFLGSESDEIIGKQRKCLILRKLNHTKKLMKEMSERYAEINLKKEMTEKDLEYSHSKNYFTILGEILKKWALVIFIVCIIGAEILNNPLVILLWIALIVSAVLTWIIIEKFDFEIILIVPVIIGIIALGYTVISLLLNIGNILIYFSMIYFEFAIFIGAIWALHLYKGEVQSEQERIKKQIKRASEKINDWKRGDIEGDIDKLDRLIYHMNSIFKQIERNKENNKAVEAYWDFLFLGSCFLVGLRNSLDKEFINSCYGQIDNIQKKRKEWGYQNEYRTE